MDISVIRSAPRGVDADKHVKLCGGHIRTANHDRQRMKDARDAVAKANKEERERAILRGMRNEPRLHGEG